MDGIKKYIQMTHIGGLMRKKLRKSDFKINRPQTLFGPDWSMLQQKRCPHCSNKLTEMPSKPGWLICRGTKHKKRFVIHNTKLSTAQS